MAGPGSGPALAGGLGEQEQSDHQPRDHSSHRPCVERGSPGLRRAGRGRGAPALPVEPCKQIAAVKHSRDRRGPVLFPNALAGRGVIRGGKCRPGGGTIILLLLTFGAVEEAVG